MSRTDDNVQFVLSARSAAKAGVRSRHDQLMKVLVRYSDTHDLIEDACDSPFVVRDSSSARVYAVKTFRAREPGLSSQLGLFYAAWLLTMHRAGTESWGLGHDIGHGYIGRVEPKSFDPSRDRELQSLKGTVRELRKQLARVRGECKQLRADLNEVQEIVGVSEVISEQESPTAWISKHSTALNQHRGKVVAIHSVDGVVAAGESVLEVWNKIRDRADAQDLLVHTVI